MQDKLRKLYLYASNTKTLSRKSNQTITEYTQKKHQNIENLKLLLNNQIGLPAIASLLVFPEQQNIDNQQKQSNQQKKDQIQKIRMRKRSLSHIRSIVSSPSRLLQLSPHRMEENIRQQKKIKQKLQKIKQQQKQKKYQKYINEYMQKIKKDKILDQCPEEDYSKLVQEACKQIRNQLQQQEKLSILQVDINMEDSNQQSYFLSLKPKKQKKRKIRLSAINLQGNKVHSVDSHCINHSDSQTKINYYGHNQSKTLSNKLYMKGSQQKQSKVIAENNLYKINLDMITKVSHLKQKQRKRSQRNFVRNLTKISFLDSTHHSKNK